MADTFKERADKFTQEFNSLVKKYNVNLRVVQKITPDGRIDADLHFIDVETKEEKK